MAVFFQPVGFGTTSAHAENTFSPSTSRTPPKNYLRMRGEYPSPIERVRAAPELPPHARRIRCLACRSTLQIGTTSACAENTRGSLPLPLLPRNYLRVRGEYAPWMRGLLSPRELPPRARRIRDAETGHFATLGTTSACAENTGFHLNFGFTIRNYLRVRGEYPGPTSNASPMRELPPRARRIRAAAVLASLDDGTTSACAENT